MCDQHDDGDEFQIMQHDAAIAIAQGLHEPYLLALSIEKAGRWRGVAVPLELHGRFASDYQRAMAVNVLRTLRVTDLPDALATAGADVYNPDGIVY